MAAKKKMRVLLDVDGVVADWMGAVDRVLAPHGVVTDKRKFFSFADLPPELIAEVVAKLDAPGFADTLRLLPGAERGVAALRAAGFVVHFVTAPWGSPTWVYDRTQWLLRHGLIFSTCEVTFTHAKELIMGDLFVDDTPDMVQRWESTQARHGVCWAQPWNADVHTLIRYNDWSRLLSHAEQVRGAL